MPMSGSIARIVKASHGSPPRHPDACSSRLFRRTMVSHASYLVCLYLRVHLIDNEPEKAAKSQAELEVKNPQLC